MELRTIIPGEIPVRDMHQFLIGSVAPRPIAFVSTVDTDGNSNLAPYSFFNAFSSNPPILVFSSNRRVRGNTTKDTLANVQATRECVINVVSHRIVRQMTLTSVEFATGISEFDKSGLTALPSEVVKPFRVQESPVQMECVVKDIITLGTHGGAGHLIINEVKRMHIAEDIIDENNRIDPQRIDLMGRMGRSFYVRAHGDAVQPIVQPVLPVTVGFDGLPESVRKSPILTGNEISEIAALQALPAPGNMDDIAHLDRRIKPLLSRADAYEALHLLAREKLTTGNVDDAAKILLLADQIARNK